MKAYFQTFAAYNAWANARLFEAVNALTEAQYRQNVGLFFGSVHGTLNHVLVGDRMWMRRITDEGPSPTKLDEILFEDRSALHAARIQEDQRIIAHIDSRADADFASTLRYRNTSGQEFEQPLTQVLAHFFNHQTHHRGQAHAALTQLTSKAPPLDLLYYLRN